MPRASMHTDCTDALRQMYSEEQLERAKAELMAAYGDVELLISPDEAWFKQIVIDDPRWQADYEDYCNRKADWCRKHTSE